jgi:hypothetical protein
MDGEYWAARVSSELYFLEHEENIKDTQQITTSILEMRCVIMGNIFLLLAR